VEEAEAARQRVSPASLDLVIFGPPVDG